jgi:hypothetical protein
VPATSVGWTRGLRITLYAGAALYLFGALTAPAPSMGETPSGLHVVPLGGVSVYTAALDSNGTPWVAGSADATHVGADGRVVRYRLPLKADSLASAWAGGAFWIVDEDIHGVTRVTADGRYTRYPGVWGATNPADEYAPSGITEGPDRTLWLEDPQRHRIVSVASDGAVRTVTPLRADVLIDFIGADADGSVWYTDFRRAEASFDPHGGISRILPDGRVVEVFRDRRSIIVDGTVAPNGDVWCIVLDHAYAEGLLLMRIDRQGRIIRFPSPTAPFEIAVARDGTIWLFGNVLARINPDGRVVRMRHPSFRYPDFGPFFFGPDGRLWFGFGLRSRFAWMSPNPCLSRRRVTVHLHARRGNPIRSVRVIIPGQLSRTVRGRDPTILVDLRGYLPATVPVILKVRAAHRNYTQRRSFRTCGNAS